jgi:hypothetical protein
MITTMVASLSPGASGAAIAANAYIRYSSTRTLWVEPVTGSIVDYEEEQQRTLVVLPGVQYDLLNATFRYTPETRRTIVDEASRGRNQIQMLRWYAPAGVGVLGLLLLALGLLLLLRRRRVATTSDPVGVPGPGE